MNTLRENLELLEEVHSVAENLRTSVKGISKHFSYLAKLTDEGIAKDDAKSGKFQYIRTPVTLRSIVLKENGSGEFQLDNIGEAFSGHFATG